MSLTNRGINTPGWCLIGGVVVTIVASFLPWYSISFLGLTASANGWNSYWWLPTVLAVGAAVAYLLGARLALLIAGALSFVVTLIILIDILVRGTSAVQLDDGSVFPETVASAGPSFGLFLTLLATGVVAYFALVLGRDRKLSAAVV